VAKYAGLLNAAIAVGTAEALRVKILGDPVATASVIQQLRDGKNHAGTLPYAQISDMSQVFLFGAIVA
jgi:hypothetical protein